MRVLVRRVSVLAWYQQAGTYSHTPDGSAIRRVPTDLRRDPLQTLRESRAELKAESLWGTTWRKDDNIHVYMHSAQVFKGRVSNFWKPMLIFEMTKTNTPLPQKGSAPILIDPPHIYIAYATQTMISSVKHKELFHRNYLKKYVPGTFFPQTCCCLCFHHNLSTEKIRKIVWWCNVRSARVTQYQVHTFRTCILGSSDFTS